MSRLLEAGAPMDFVDCVQAHREASEAQKEAEDWLAKVTGEVADAERAYRKQLALEITTLTNMGKPATLARDLARGDPLVAQLLHERMTKEGLREAAQQAIWRHTADRRDLEQFLDWSKRAFFIDQQPRATLA